MANPLDAMQLQIMRRVDHALLAEPAVSVALRETRRFPIKPIAPDLFRSVDLQREWGWVLKREPRIPRGGHGGSWGGGYARDWGGGPGKKR